MHSTFLALRIAHIATDHKGLRKEDIFRFFRRDPMLIPVFFDIIFVFPSWPHHFAFRSLLKSYSEEHERSKGWAMGNGYPM